MAAPSPDPAETSALQQRMRELSGRERPTAEDIDYLVDHATALSRAGLDDDARALLGRWIDAGHGDPDIRMAQIMLTASVPSSSAAHRRRSYESEEPADAAMEIVHCAFRGEMQRAVEIAEQQGWFMEAPTQIEGLSYAILGLVLEGRFEQAEAIIDEWKSRHAADIPGCYQMLLRFEARVAAFGHQYSRELSLVEQACALCDEQGHSTTFEFTEPDLAIALARTGDIDRARAVMQPWQRAPGTGPLNGFRDAARLEVELLAGDYDAAYRAGVDALRSPPSRLAPIHLRLRFAMVLAAPADAFAAELAELKRAVHRFPIRHFADRLRWLLRVLPTPETPARELRLRLVSSDSEQSVGLVCMWTPRGECTQADLYWDGVRGVAMLGGRGPFSLERHPVLGRLITALIESPGFELTIPKLFEETWGQPYDPLVHEGKVHVTIHRLRSWFQARGHLGAPLVVIREGRVGMSPECDVWALLHHGLQLPPRIEAPADLGARITSFLAEHGAQPPRELAQRLGISRTKLTQILRRLVEAGTLAREGGGRSVRYVVAPAR